MRKLLAIIFLLPLVGFGQQKILRGGSHSIHHRNLTLGTIKFDSVWYVGPFRGSKSTYIGEIVSDATDDELMTMIKSKEPALKTGYYKKGKEVFVIINQ